MAKKEAPKKEEAKEATELRLCTACKSCKGKMKAYGPTYLCMAKESKSLVTGDSPASCAEMRATVCGLDAALFESSAPAEAAPAG